MNLKQIRYFARIAAAQNMTRAAESLNVAQTALGLQIKNLEAELGVALIERHSRGVRLTEAGVLFHARADEMLALLDDTVRELREAASDNKPPIHIGLTPSVMSLLGSWLFTLPDTLGTQNPVRYIEGLSFTLVSAMLRDELDYALAFNVPDRPGILRKSLLEERLFLVTPAAWGKGGEPVGIHEALRDDLALLSSQDIIWSLVHETAEYLSIPLKVAFEVQSQPAIKALIEHGVATSIMPYGAVAEEVVKGTVAARPIDDSRAVRTLFLIRPAKAHLRADDAAARRLLGELVHRYADRMGAHRKWLSSDPFDL